MKLPDIKFKPEDAYYLAKIISNEYIGTSDTIQCIRRTADFYSITSNKCDSCPIIRVYCSLLKTGIEKIEVLGDYTDGWQEVHQFTYDRIKKELHAETP